MGDWLGNGRIRRNGWRPFEEARAFVRKLGLKSSAEWRAYCNSEGKPNDIPSTPHKLYADAGWNGWSDWLGSGGVRRTGWRPFEEARAFVQKLGLKSVVKDWRGYCRSGKKPTDIPSNPSTVYADAGWNGWGDWLGTGRRRGNGWRPFEEARIFAQKMELNSRTSGWSTVAREKNLTTFRPIPQMFMPLTGTVGGLAGRPPPWQRLAALQRSSRFRGTAEIQK